MAFFLENRNHPWFRYGIALLAFVVAFVMAFLLWPFTKETPFLLFLAAVAVSAWFGGLFPGLLTALLSFVVVHAVLIEPRSFDLSDGSNLFQIITFTLVAFVISWTESNQRRSLGRLENTREELLTILDRVADGVTAQDSDGTVRYANVAAAAITGNASVAEMKGSSIAIQQGRFKIYDIEGRLLDYTALPRHQTVEHKDAQSLTFQMEQIDTGERRWVHLTTSPVLSSEGEVTLVVNVMRDISEQMELMLEQKRSREHLQKLLDALPVMIAVISPEGIVEQINAAAEKAGRLVPAETIGHPLVASRWWVNDPEQQREIAESIKQARSGFVVRFDTQVTMEEKFRQHVDLMVAPMFDERQKISHFVISAVNITHRKDIERELTAITLDAEARRQRLNAIIENVPGIVYVGAIDPEIQTLSSSYISPYVESMLGYSPEHWEKDPGFFEKIIHPDDLPRVQEEAQRELLGSGVTRLQFRIITAGEDIIHVESHSTLILDEEGRPAGLCGVIMDITQRKIAENRLTEYAAMLQSSNEELERFAYIASHDLQEPLRMVTSFLQLIEQRYADRLDDAGREFIDYAVGGAERMKQLITDLLAYSRLQRSRDEAEPLSMDVVLAQVLENLQVTIEESEALITHDELPEIHASRTEIIQLLQNLIGNALKFRSDNPPHIHVSARREGGGWVFSVADNGIGMDPAFQGQIFDIFRRLHTRDEYPGTGIGLAICKKIVERHQGEIWVESAKGTGSTFYFSLPVTRKRRLLTHGSD